MAVTQQHRSIQVFSPLGDDVLWFYRMHAVERLAGPFTYELEVLSDDPSIKPAKILGENVTVQLVLPDDSHRYFNGYVSRFGQYGTVDAFPYYRLTLRPWLWFLTRNGNCRIFQQKTVPDIVKQVFRDQGFSDFEESLSGNYPVRDYCVQYRESDFNFISRLLEEEGIYYFFKHEKGKHVLILADALGAHAVVAGYEEIPYFDPGNPERRKRDHVFEWSFAQHVQPGRYALTDYDFTKPKSDLLVKAAVQRPHAHAAYECFDYPGEYAETADGDGYARCRIEELHAQFEQVNGRGNARGLTTGALWKLSDHPRADQNRDYLVTSAEYQLKSDQYFTAAAGTQEDIYHCSFTAIEQQTPFRPQRSTVKPIVQGPQTAVVVGPAGEEIYTDKYGRVKVQFHWDRYGKKDENSSCWVRVSHPWAGKNWGMIAIPRIGQEVIVDFLEGDPDQPIVTGRVYNADQMPPYALPANATQTGIQSRSSKGGSGANCNEFRFEDKKGAEQVYLHAEKNQDISVENDETTSVGHDRTETVGNNETISIGVNRTETVGNNESITVGANRTRNVGQNEIVNVGLTRTHNVGVNEMINVGAAQEIAVGGLQTLTVGATRAVTVAISQATTIGTSQTTTIGTSQSTTIGSSLTESVGTDHSQSVGGNQTISAGKNQSISVGDNRSAQVGKDDSLKVGKNLVIDAGDSITIKTGDASITMKKNGDIAIKGNNISIRGSGKINVKADSDVVIKGSKIGEN